jgi:putative membrane protein
MAMAPLAAGRGIVASPLPLLVVAVTAAAYEIGRQRWRAAAGRSMVSPFAVARFLAGLGAVAVALASPLDAAADTSLVAHMVQHVLLIAVASPLLALGAPLPTLLWALPPRWRPSALRGSRRLARAHDRQYAAWVAASLIVEAIVMWGWHVPDLYDAAVRNAALHACEHASFLLVSTAAWWCVATGPRSLRGAAAIASLLGSVPGMLLGAAMVLAPNPWYPIYAAGGTAHALTQQQIAGVVMWGFGGMAVVIAGAALFASWLSTPTIDAAGRIATVAPSAGGAR